MSFELIPKPKLFGISMVIAGIFYLIFGQLFEEFFNYLGYTFICGGVIIFLINRNQ
jgi:hypothetical protein